MYLLWSGRQVEGRAFGEQVPALIFEKVRVKERETAYLGSQMSKGSLWVRTVPTFIVHGHHGIDCFI